MYSRSAPVAKEIDRSIRHLEAVVIDLDHEISSTPTGAARNHLCDANIHVMAALENLREARNI